MTTRRSSESVMNPFRRRLVLSCLAAAAVAIAAGVSVPRLGLAQPVGMPSLAPILKKITPAVVEIEIKGRLPRNPAKKKA